MKIKKKDLARMINEQIEQLLEELGDFNSLLERGKKNQYLTEEMITFLSTSHPSNTPETIAAQRKFKENVKAIGVNLTAISHIIMGVHSQEPTPQMYKALSEMNTNYEDVKEDLIRQKSSFMHGRDAVLIQKVQRLNLSATRFVGEINSYLDSHATNLDYGV